MTKEQRDRYIWEYISSNLNTGGIIYDVNNQCINIELIYPQIAMAYKHRYIKFYLDNLLIKFREPWY